MIYRTLTDIQVVLGVLIPIVILFLRRRSLFDGRIVRNITGWILIILIVYVRAIWTLTSTHMWTTPIRELPPYYTETDIIIGLVLGFLIIAMMLSQLYSYLSYRKTYYDTIRQELAHHEARKFDDKIRED